MALISTRVLVINQQLNFAIKIKQALESIGAFEVTPFTAADTALDYLRRRPQDVVLVDFTLPGISGAELTKRIRTIQPDIAIIASPDRPEVAVAVRDLRLHGLIDVPIAVRTLIPLIKQAVMQVRDSLPDTMEAPALKGDTETLIIAAPPPGIPEFSSLDSVLVRVGGLEMLPGAETLDVDMSDAANGDGRTVEFVITGGMNVLKDQFEQTKSDHPLANTAKEAVGIFQQLAAEEPPMPTLEESGTVGDLMIGVGDTNLRDVVEILRREVILAPSQPKIVSVEDQDAMRDSIPAQVILQTTLDETMPLDEMLNTLELAAPPALNISERYVREPDFLETAPPLLDDSQSITRKPDFLPETTSQKNQSTPLPSLPEFDPSSDLSIHTTQMTYPDEVIADPGSLETDVLKLPVPPATLPEMKHPQEMPAAPEKGISAADDLLPPYEFPAVVEDYVETAPLDAQEVAEFETDFGGFDVLPDELLAEFEDTAAPPVRVTVGIESDDPQIAQLALSLTQVSLELTAEATLLALNGEIVAYAGSLPLEDIEDLGQAIGDDWEAKPEETRIRFVTLSGSGKDYMLYSRFTEGGFTLTMIFAGNMPLRVIRRQSDRLVEALQTVPDVAQIPEMLIDEMEVTPEEVAFIDEAQLLEPLPEVQQSSALVATVVEPTVSVPIGPLTPYAYVWLVRDPEHALSDPVAQAIVVGLDIQLTRMGWQVNTLRVYEDYVYLLADIPGEAPPSQLVQELKRLASDVAYGADIRLDPATLWAESYMTVLPGREPSWDEIQRYIHFARMRG
ncbi:MAG: response regulator [Chitinophagaceae bacterium]|nr:response regulator [Anaerolineae bacterium]